MGLEGAIDLVLCGVLLAGLSFLAQHFQPDLPRLTFFTGVAGGGLCFLWGFLGRRRPGCRVGAMVTLATVACVFVRQAVQSWETSAGGEAKGRPVAVLVTLLVVFCIGVLANLTQEGKGHKP
jgi:peptidoglycan/LPS O-acetylase OafA/YrhL